MDAERGALAGRRSSADLTTVRFGDRLHEREPEACAFRGHFFGVRALGEEPIEDARQILFRDAGAGIRHFDQHASVSTRELFTHDRYRDLTLITCKGRRIVDEVPHERVEARRDALDDRLLAPLCLELHLWPL